MVALRETSSQPWDFEVLNFPTLSGRWLTYPSEKYELLVSWDDDIPNIWKYKTCSKPPTSSQYVVASLFEHDFLIQFWGWDMEKIQKTQPQSCYSDKYKYIHIHTYKHISVYLYVYIYICIYIYIYILHIHNTVYTVSLKPGVSLCAMGCSESQLT